MILPKQGAVFNKYVPTDMSWSPSFEGWYARVAICANGSSHFHVSVSGNDDTALVRFFNDWDKALNVYNSLTYIQSSLDLAEFAIQDENNNNNGWPGERTKFTGRAYPEEADPEPINPLPRIRW